MLGPSGKGHIRVSLGTPADRVREAMVRVNEWGLRAGQALNFSPRHYFTDKEELDSHTLHKACWWAEVGAYP